MSMDVEFKAAPDAALPVTGYNRVLKTVHWASLLLVIAAFMAVWMSHAAASREQSALLVQLHRSIGITVFAVTLFRLAWRWTSRIPPLPTELPLVQKIAARVTEYALYFLLLL